MQVGNAVVGFDHDRFRYVPDPDEWTSLDNAGGNAENDKIFDGITESGLDHVLVESVNHDGGDVSGATSAKVQLKFLPAQQRGLGGGDVYQTYAALDTYQKRRMPFGARLNPGEALTVRVKNNVANSNVRLRLVRWRAYPKAMTAAAR